MDHSKLGSFDLLYGMICVLEESVQAGLDWRSYIRHLKFVANQMRGRQFRDCAYVSYDRFIIDQFVKSNTDSFVTGDMLGVASNFHAGNLIQGGDFRKSWSGRGGRGRGNKWQYSNREESSVPPDWPDDLCYNFNFRRCSGRCSRLHICNRCRQNHKGSVCRPSRDRN